MRETIIIRDPVGKECSCLVDSHGTLVTFRGYTCIDRNEQREGGCNVLHSCLREAMVCLLTHWLDIGASNEDPRMIRSAKLTGYAEEELTLFYSPALNAETFDTFVQDSLDVGVEHGRVFRDGSLDLPAIAADIEYSLEQSPPPPIKQYEMERACPVPFAAVIDDLRKPAPEAIHRRQRRHQLQPGTPTNAPKLVA